MAILALAAVVLDGGNAYAQRRQIQNAADSAALAGAHALWLGQGSATAQAAACDYAARNGATTCTVNQVMTNSINLTVSRTFDTFFAGVLGYEQLTVQATASAAVRPLVPEGTLWPVIVKYQEFQVCPPTEPCGSAACPKYEIWNSNKEAAGNAGWTDWDGPPVSAVQLAEALRNPAVSGHWDIGDWIPGDPGLKDSSAVRSAIADKQCQHVTVPAWDVLTGSGANTRYHIIAFAEFLLTDYKLTGNPKYIKGQFLRWTEPGTTIPGTCTTGYCGVRLTN
jgi:hypothetical protein